MSELERLQVHFAELRRRFAEMTGGLRVEIRETEHGSGVLGLFDAGSKGHVSPWFQDAHAETVYGATCDWLENEIRELETEASGETERVVYDGDAPEDNDWLREA